MSTRAQTTIDGKTFGIGVLSVTACVLFVGLMLVPSRPPVQPAYGIGMNDRGGDYIMLTQQLSETREGVVLIDAATKKMIVYAFDLSRRSLEIADWVPLDQLPKLGALPEPDARPGARRRP